MDPKDKTGLAAVANAADAVSKSDHEKAVSAAIDTATADGVKQGATAERVRIKAIVGSEQAKGREALAQHLAFDTDQTAEQAVALLDKSPKAEAPKGGRLDAAMAAHVPDVAAAETAKHEPANELAASMQDMLAKKYPDRAKAVA